MSNYTCGNCGAQFSKGKSSCPQCGTPRTASHKARQAQTEKTCGYCGEIVHQEDRFCESCGADLTEFESDAGQDRGERESGDNKHPRGKAILTPRIQPVTDGKVPKFDPHLVSSRKSAPKRNSLSPLVLMMIAFLIFGCAGAIAYRSFRANDDLPVNQPNDSSTPVVDNRNTSDDGSFVSISNPQSAGDSPPEASAAQSGPRYSWSSWSESGYSRIVPANPSDVSPVPGNPKGTVLGDRVRLRAEPNTNSKIILHFNRNDSIEVLQRYSSVSEDYYWFNVSGKGKTGWMYGQYVSIAIE
ncbi:MAG: zinc ribbon domain-containing protein [Synergistaceae bacterium]|jgi:RNA polymerase subunit RPABC4/transcription elongation factor Spt4|nr:zinc ribbon domain-containing protein [Synergistaceae bacterium]